MKPLGQDAKIFFAFMWHFLKEYKIAVFSYTLLALLAGFLGPFNSVLLKKLINLLPQASKGDASILIAPASLIVVNFIVLDNFTWRGITYIKYRFLPFILNKIDCSLLDYTLLHSYQFFQERMAGSLARNIVNLVNGIQKIIEQIASNVFMATTLLLMALVFAYQVNVLFFFILGIWILLFFGVSLVMSKRLSVLSADQSSKESVLGCQIIDTLTHAFSVKLCASRHYEISRRSPALSAHNQAFQKKEWYLLVMHSIQGGLIGIMLISSIYSLIYLYGKNLVSMGDFALIITLCTDTGYMMWFVMADIDEFFKEIGRSRQSLSKLLHPTGVKDRPYAGTLNCVRGHIRFQNVTFAYQSPLFQRLTVEILPGQKVGLVGYSGGGKTTFINLILRLYDIAEGEIFIDGQNVREVTQDSLRQNISMIPQDPLLFHRSLIENIRYGRIDATDEEVIVASKKAYAHEFIEKLPKGYDSLVGERGVKLSGGQRQRITIARAILKNAPILILDEATSQLDSMTENLIQESLWELMQDKTTLVIAHRLSTLLQMDRILVFDQGKIVEDGTHYALLLKNGLYKKLWDTQVGSFLGDEKEISQ